LKQAVLALQEQGPVTSALAVSSNNNLETLTKEEITAKLISYQQFMAKYIVEAHQQKVEAVREAQLAIAKKYEDKLLLLTAASGAPVETTAEAGLYQERSANVSAAAAAGKSRWGDMENARAAEAIGVNGATASVSSVAPVPVPVPAPTLSLYDKRNAKIAAAAKVGKSRWSSEENERAFEMASALPSIAPVSANGATAPALISVTAAVGGVSLFDKRNINVAAAAKAGKSRWGNMENDRALQMASSLPAVGGSSSAVPPAVGQTDHGLRAAVSAKVVEEADHGLRADGGVAGPTLAERLNAGEQLMKSNGATAPALISVTAAVGGVSLYDKRNVNVAAAFKAGKSRWGDMENDRALQMASSLPAFGGSSSAVPAEVEEADHGLRADGGVGGATLAQRVNLGASLLGP
jgi:hypothetical protein